VEDEAAFRYHADSGKCLNAAGEEGRNPYDSAAIHGSKRAECVNLSYLELILLEKGEVSSTDDTLKGWDFRGAGFYGSQLHFNHIIGADFRGAGLSGLDFGYAVLEGKVDSFTAIPREGCVLNGTSLRCVR
jgi:uncharacterized protein YjbI with pentapeptide repeats